MKKTIVAVILSLGLLAGSASAAPSLSQRLKWAQLKLSSELADHLAPLIGITELFGLRYAVKPYRATVSDRVMRGSRLTPADVAQLKAQGVGTIVSFCLERNRAEERAAKENGLRFVRIPVLDNTAPRPGQIRKFVKVATDGTPGLVYGHCEAGQGRTGVFMAGYRIAAQGWPIGKAVAEAHHYGLKLRSQRQAIIDFGRAVRAEQHPAH